MSTVRPLLFLALAVLLSAAGCAQMPPVAETCPQATAMDKGKACRRAPSAALQSFPLTTEVVVGELARAREACELRYHLGYPTPRSPLPDCPAS